MQVDALTGAGTFEAAHPEVQYVSDTIGINNGSSLFSGND